jgi:hypothetical protein
MPADAMHKAHMRPHTSLWTHEADAAFLEFQSVQLAFAIPACSLHHALHSHFKPKQIARTG